ncbi:MAG: hypothetical protein LBT70_02085 [Holosporaceae bacterium]|jgi:hypothetical protein|nr:hypothetical protein [Holosporaceae bacterium]
MKKIIRLFMVAYCAMQNLNVAATQDINVAATQDINAGVTAKMEAFTSKKEWNKVIEIAQKCFFDFSKEKIKPDFGGKSNSEQAKIAFYTLKSIVLSNRLEYRPFAISLFMSKTLSLGTLYWELDLHQKSIVILDVMKLLLVESGDSSRLHRIYCKFFENKEGQNKTFGGFNDFIVPVKQQIARLLVLNAFKYSVSPLCVYSMVEDFLPLDGEPKSDCEQLAFENINKINIFFIDLQQKETTKLFETLAVQDKGLVIYYLAENLILHPMLTKKSKVIVDILKHLVISFPSASMKALKIFPRLQEKMKKCIQFLENNS